MKKKLFILKATDTWHTKASETVLGVFSSKGKIINTIKERKYKLTDHDITTLIEKGQTFGLDTNFMMEEIILNTLI